MEVEKDAEVELQCEICSDDNYEENPMYTCRKCNVKVHVDCYGNPLRQMEKDDVWICQKCEFNAASESCVLCPVKGGPMKRTSDWKWAHLSCAMWIPECFFRNPDGMEPIDYLQIPNMRWNNKCTYCKKTQGACMQCSQPGCSQKFHITCGMKENIFLEYQTKKTGADVIVAFCSEHSKRWHSKNKSKK